MNNPRRERGCVKRNTDRHGKSIDVDDMGIQHAKGTSEDKSYQCRILQMMDKMAEGKMMEQNFRTPLHFQSQRR
jgi:hypothetical protein